MRSARVNASSSSRTQSYELGGINEGSNYSVSMAAISRHLPSPAVGSPILSGEHQQDWPQLGHCVCVLKCCLVCIVHMLCDTTRQNLAVRGSQEFGIDYSHKLLDGQRHSREPSE